MNNVVLIPSARLVPMELQVEFGPIPSAMVPIQGRPALSYLIDQYRARGYDVYVGVNQGKQDIQDYVNFYGQSVHVIDVGETRCLGETILRLAEAVDGTPEICTINFGDTFISDLPACPDAIFVDKPLDLFRWTTFESVADGSLGKITEKDEAKPLYNGQQAFAGVFSFADPVTLKSRLRHYITHGTDDAIDPFYAALRDLFNGCPPTQRCLQQVESWLDFGHLDSYYEAKRRMGCAAREFNDVIVDHHRGSVIKTSKNVSKFRDEVLWFTRLPRDLVYLTPRIFQYDIDSMPPMIELEFYGYPALNDLFLFGAHDLGMWVRVFESIRKTVNAMQAYKALQATPESRVAALYEMYVTKTLHRLNQIVDQNIARPFIGDEIYINGVCCPGLNCVIERLEAVVERGGLLEDRPFSVIHGDLCPSNILYDTRNSFIRLVDPRGRFGSFDIYGDPLYDMAKLCHSFEGGYDFMASGLFTFKQDNKGIHLVLYQEQRHLKITELFNQWLSSFLSCEEIQKARLIESLLFLSMVPLHSDRPKSQQAFLATGLLLMNDYWSAAQ